MKGNARPMRVKRPEVAVRATVAPSRSIVPIGDSGRPYGEQITTEERAIALTPAAKSALGPIVARGLGFDLHAAVQARRVRFVAVYTIDGRPLPADWAIPIQEREVVVACAPLLSPLSGVAALIVCASALPQPKVDDAARERIAHALADVLLAEIRASKR